MDMYAIDGFCQRWLDKASRYQDRDLEGLFDKFFTLFVVYNRLYSAAAEIVRGRTQMPGPTWLRGDRNEATMAMERFIRQERFSLLVASQPSVGYSCAAIADLLQQRRFFLHTRSDNNEPDWNRDARLIEGLTMSRLKAVLDCLYQIRCNMFHGQKEFAPRQAELLLPAIGLLECIIKLSKEAFQEHNTYRFSVRRT